MKRKTNNLTLTKSLPIGEVGGAPIKYVWGIIIAAIAFLLYANTVDMITH